MTGTEAESKMSRSTRGSRCFSNRVPFTLRFPMLRHLNHPLAYIEYGSTIVTTLNKKPRPRKEE